MKWCTFFFAVMPAVLFAQDIPMDKMGAQISSLEAGVICAPPTTGVSEAPDTVAGTTHLIDVNPPFVSVGRRVPAVIGIGFGVKAQAFDLEGVPDVTIVITHPPMEGVTSQTFQSRISGLDQSLTFYQFDFDYELVTGRWQMEAMQGKTLLYRAAFDVVPPAKVLELASVCGFEELLS